MQTWWCTAWCGPRTAQHGLQRLRAALEEAEIWDEAFAARVRVVAGDIGEARLGLSPTGFDELAQRIDAVYHFAADVSLSASYLRIRKTNAFSMRNVLELCLHTRRKHLFYASTMGVFPQYFGDFANEFAGSSIGHQGQPDLADMKRLFPLGVVGYPWSKVVAEQSLLFAQQAGLPVAIFRLPQTSRSSEGFTQPNDTTVRVYAAIDDVQMIPDGFSFQGHSHSVDALSRICTAISANPERRYTLYQCCNPNPVQHELELADFGLYLREVSYAAFKRACQARGEVSPLHGFWALLDHFSPYWFSANKARTALPVCDRALREDCPFPIEWPGILTMFRRTNDWVRRHRQQWPFPLAEPRLDYDCLLMRAERYAERMEVSFAQTYPDWIRDGLAQLVQALQAPEARLLENKRAVAVSDLSRGLRNNAALAGERQCHPEIDREEVTRPVFIIGINRTGTTYLHRLLSRDPRFWTLRGFELLEPVLTNGSYTETAWTPADVRRLRLQDVVVAAGFSESFAGVHQVDVDEPEEDFGIVRQTFASWSNTNIYQVPEYGPLARGNRFAARLRLPPPRHAALYPAAAPAAARAAGAVVVEGSRPSDGTGGAGRRLSGRLFHPDPPRAAAVRGLLVQSDRAGPLPDQRTALPPRPRRGAVGVHERHARPVGTLPERPSRTAAGLVRRELRRPGRRPVGNRAPNLRALRLAAGAGGPRRHGGLAGPAGGAAPWRAAASLRPEGLRLDARSGRRRLLRLPGVHRQPATSAPRNDE